MPEGSRATTTLHPTPPRLCLGPAGCYMALHATHRLEHHHLASSRADVAALDSVAQQQWEHPPVDGSGGGMEGMQQELLAARAQQGQQGPAAGGRGSDGSGTAGSEGAAAAASNIVKVVGLYPFLQFDPDCSKQLQLQRLTRHHTALARVAAAARLLPLALRRALVRLAAPNLEPHAVDVTVQGRRAGWAWVPCADPICACPHLCMMRPLALPPPRPPPQCSPPPHASKTGSTWEARSLRRWPPPPTGGCCTRWAAALRWSWLPATCGSNSGSGTRCTLRCRAWSRTGCQPRPTPFAC